MRQIHRLLPAALLALALPSCTGLPGGSEMLIIAGVVLLLFGGSKLPQLMRGMGSGINEFKKGLKEGEGEPEEKKDDPPKQIPSDGDGQ